LAKDNYFDAYPTFQLISACYLLILTFTSTFEMKKTKPGFWKIRVSVFYPGRVFRESRWI